MPLHGMGQSPHESFLVMILSTSLPSILWPLVARGKSREPTPFQFLTGESPFSTLMLTAAVVPRSLQSWRMAGTGAWTFMPRRAMKRYTQLSHFLGLLNQTTMRMSRPTSFLYSSVICLHRAPKVFLS